LEPWKKQFVFAPIKFREGREPGNRLYFAYGVLVSCITFVRLARDSSSLCDLSLAALDLKTLPVLNQPPDVPIVDPTLAVGDSDKIRKVAKEERRGKKKKQRV
jgi:hypothetical protein